MNDYVENETRGYFAKFLACARGMTERDQRNARVTNWWRLGWMVWFVSASFAMRDGYLAGQVAWVVIVVSAGLGLMVVRSYMRFIREADELLRKIQLEALAIGFGAAFVGNFIMAMIERASSLTFDAGDLFLLMVIAYMVGIFTGTRRYA